jgi:hypothetical protein
MFGIDFPDRKTIFRLLNPNPQNQIIIKFAGKISVSRENLKMFLK